ncbi:MAG: ABC transporter ATP-binding protein [Sphingobacteriales bacterium]|nr:MAG: ABC transporter ATP-binding protein [Sphingobacteriales bacterium]
MGQGHASMMISVAERGYRVLLSDCGIRYLYALKKIIAHTLAVLNNRERSRLGRITVMQMLLSLADIASLAVLLAIIHLYTSPDQAPAPVWMPKALLQQHFLLPIGLFLILFTLKNIAGYYIVRTQYHYVYGVASRLSRQSMYQYLNGNYRDYVEIPTAVRIRQISHQPIEFSNYVLNGLMQAGAELSVTIIAVVAILIFNAQIFLLLLLLLVPPVILASWFTKKKLRSSRQEVKHTSEKATQYLNEALDSYIESNIYHSTSFFSGRYAAFQKKLNDNLAQLQVTQAIPTRFMEVFAVLGLFILILVNHYNHSPAATDLVNIGAFMAAAYKIIPGITRMANISAQVRTYAYTIHDISPEKESDIMPFNAVNVHLKDIVFQSVCYARGDKQILERFNSAIRGGDFVGIAAASGKGKTTLINLLLGFLEPDQGCILFNDLPVNAVARQQFWPDIAYVKQQQFLIQDTIARNIVLHEGPYDEARLQEVIEVTGLQTFIKSLPDGTDHVLADNGKNISGGQRQRIAIARALYKNAGLIILDEPFNELDQASASLLVAHFRRLAQEGKIVIMIAHHTSSLAGCNKMIRLDE